MAAINNNRLDGNNGYFNQLKLNNLDTEKN